MLTRMTEEDWDLVVEIFRKVAIQARGQRQE
jgi:hypothetical protein